MNICMINVHNRFRPIWDRGGFIVLLFVTVSHIKDQMLTKRSTSENKEVYENQHVRHHDDGLSAFR